MAKAAIILFDDFTEMRNAEFYDTPAFSGATGGTIGDITITGEPGSACGVTSTVSGDDANPGNGSGWFAGGDQNPPCPQVVLDLSAPVAGFGVSFIHVNKAGVNTSNPGRLKIFDGPGGTGECIGEVASQGGQDVIDFVGMVSRVAPIRSAIVDSAVPNTSFAASGYAALQRRKESG